MSKLLCLRSLFAGCVVASMAACFSTSMYGNTADLGGSQMWADTVNVAAGNSQKANITVLLADSARLPITDTYTAVLPGAFQVSAATPWSNANGLFYAAVDCTVVGEEVIRVGLSVPDLSKTYMLPATLNVNFFPPANSNNAIPVGFPLNYLLRLPGYTGTLHFTSTDPAASLPEDTLFAASAQGLKEFVGGVTLYAVGLQTVTATDVATGAVVDQQTFLLAQPNASNLRLSLSTAMADANQPVQFTVTVTGDSNNADVNYTGTVHFTAADPQASLPADYTFTQADAGVHTFTATFKTAGQQTLTVVDGVATNGAQANTATITVQPGALARLVVAAPASTVAGDAFTLIVAATDIYGNTVPSFTGKVSFTSNDTGAALPPTYTFTASNHGSVAFSDVVLVSSGVRTLTVQDSALQLTGQATVNVLAATVVDLVLQVPSTIAAGSSFTAMVRAQDQYGNLSSGYTGTVRVSGSAVGIYPGSYTFSTVDAGQHTFQQGLVLRTAGRQVLQVVDLTRPGLAGDANILVSALAPFALQLTGLPNSVVAGTLMSASLASVDQYGNPAAPPYQGSVTFASSDANASLPSSEAFVPNANGAMTFPQAFKLVTAGAQTITVSPQGGGSILPGNAYVSVGSGPADKLIINGLGTVTALGTVVYQAQAQNFALMAVDQYNNPAATYAGKVHFTSTDTTATLPPDKTFVGASAQLAATFNTVGNANFVATDAANNLSVAANGLDVLHPCLPYGPSTQLSATWGYPPVAAFNAADAPAVAWSDPTDGSLQTYLKVLDNNSFAQLGTSASGGGISNLTGSQCSRGMSAPVSLYYDASNTLWAAYSGTCGGDSGLMYARWSGTAWVGLSGSNTFPGLLTDSNGTYNNFTLVHGADGTPLAMYSDTQSNIHVLRYSGSTWQALGGAVPKSGTLGTAALAVGPGNVPYVAYSAVPSGNYQIYVVYYNGTAWTALAGSNSGSGVSGTTGSAKNPSIVVDANSHATVAWQDDSSGVANVYVKRYNGASWAAIGSSSTGTGISASSYTTSGPLVALDTTNNPWVAWSVDLLNNKADNVYFVRWNGAAWVGVNGSNVYPGVTQFPPDPTYVLGFTLALDRSNHAVIGWTEAYGGSASLCRW